jgi:hypothetical protein
VSNDTRLQDFAGGNYGLVDLVTDSNGQLIGYTPNPDYYTVRSCMTYFNSKECNLHFFDSPFYSNVSPGREYYPRL